MLLQHLIKKEFPPQAWTQGTLAFRDNRVTAVRFRAPVVSGSVLEKRPAPKTYTCGFYLHRDGIQKPHCECSADQRTTFCQHVAALVIWWMARGSLLRAGITDETEGAVESRLAPRPAPMLNGQSQPSSTPAESPPGKKSKKTKAEASPSAAPPLKKSSKSQPEGDRSPVEPLLQTKGDSSLTKKTRTSARPAKEEVEEDPRDRLVSAVPMTFVHLVTRDDSTLGITLEPALKYTDPVYKKDRVEVVRTMRKMGDFCVWQTQRLQMVKAISEDCPFLDSVHTIPMTYMGQAGVQILGTILGSSQNDRVVFAEDLQLELCETPLKLMRFEIGAREGNKRDLRFFFANDDFEIDSEELKILASQGRLSSDFVWIDGVVYRFEMPLTTLAKHIHRSGVNVLDTIGLKPLSSLSELDDSHDTPLHPLAVYRLSLELGTKDFTVDPSWTEFHEWKRNFDRKNSPALPKVDYGFGLREYQQNGLEWIWSLYHRRLSAFLADDMGLGKTHQVLAFLSSLYCNKKFRPSEPSIVIAPTSVVAAWQHKLEKYPTGLKWIIYHGAQRELPEEGVDVVITTYGILQRDEILRAKNWHCAIADESQAIKNANTSTSRISRTLKSQFKIAMTGTPVENSSTDLWSVLEFLLPGYMGSQSRFKRLYGAKGETLPAEKARIVKKLVSPFLLRRTKSQVLTELPEKTEEIVLCEMTVPQKQVYNSYLQNQEVTRFRSELQEGGRIDYTGILALLTKLKQVCDHPELPDLTGHSDMNLARRVDASQSGKWETMVDIVHQALGSNLKVVIFTQFLAMIDLMKAWLEREGVQYAELRGDTRDRGEQIRRFSQDPECKVFICSLMAGGLGIDLTAASVCIHYDRWWNPARENQATDRLHRIGQTRGVQVFKLQCPGTVEDRIASIINRKVALSGSLIEDSSLGLKAFSRDELLSLLNELVGA